MPIDSDFAAPTDTSRDGPRNPVSILPMLWFSMLASDFIIAGTGLIEFRPVAVAGEPIDPSWLLVGILGAVSALMLALVVFAESWLGPRTKHYISYCLALKKHQSHFPTSNSPRALFSSSSTNSQRLYLPISQHPNALLRSTSSKFRPRQAPPTPAVTP